MAAAVIAACLPTLKPIAAKLLPRYFSDEYNLSNQQNQGSPMPEQQQIQHDRAPRGGQLSREFNYLFSHTSEHLWVADDVESQRRLSIHEEHSWLADDVESQRTSSTLESEGTQESIRTQVTESTQQTQETHHTEATSDSQDSGRQYFDLKDGQIVQVNDRFSALSIGFVSRYMEHYWGSMDAHSGK
ncbi:hypothetical protein BKA65DRAFT_153859 [Rhexocercosporidium sp. MPI-PUGE-AT-0058]|nr:hypothetical protein BKA65DRAFT_153859 [Rhexocercosporidium sp. MPI-PUGE-AT-0058]